VRQPKLHRVRSLLEILSAPERRLLGCASLAQAIERVAVVAATASVAFSGARHGVLVAIALAAVFFVRSVIGSTLRMRARSRTLQVLVQSLLADVSDATAPMSDEAELAYMEGLYATEDVLAEQLPRLAGDGAACLVLMALVLWLEPFSLVAAGSLAVVFGALVAVVVRRFAAASSERQWEALLPALADLSSAIHGRLEIVGNGDAEAFERDVAGKLSAWRQQSVGARTITFLAGRAPVVGAAVVVGLFFLGQGGWGSVALAHAAVLASVTPAFAGVAKGALDIARSLVRASPLAVCLERAGRVSPEGTSTARLPSVIAWSGVTFSYPDQTTPTLQAVDVTWRPGELLGLAGQNGSGKSTFLRLLLGLHEPGAGSVLVGDVPLRDLDRTAFRRQVAYLAQRPFLPDRMTVAQAIHLLAPDASLAAMQATLTRLSLWPVLVRRSREAPLDTRLGALSAGEKQRVAVARVLLRDARLLLLDEPDANLDAEGVVLVADLLREEAKRRMVLVIAHSPALLAAAHRVVHLDDGRVRAG
jgi:ATP-binding cassette subfamily C protein CydCD